MIKHYSPNNAVDYVEVMKIPVSERLPELSKKIGISDMGKILMAEITKFQNCYNVIRPMNADQIAQCAFAIIQTSEEDFLSLQDIVLFFEGAKQGKYGKVYDRIDQQIIFEMLEIYRQSRHETFIRVEEEKHIVHKSTGDFGRSTNDSEKEAMRAAQIDYLRTFQKD